MGAFRAAPHHRRTKGALNVCAFLVECIKQRFVFVLLVKVNVNFRTGRIVCSTVYLICAAIQKSCMNLGA